MEAYHDCPACPKCKGPVVLPANHPNGYRCTERLMCAACGFDFPGSEAEYHQARRADEAWEKHEREELSPRPYQGGKP